MRLPQNKLQRAKAALHGIQAVLVFVAGCLTLAVMTKSGGYGGQTGFYFALCFLTLPAILYMTIGPLWSRLWRLNNVYAYTTIDLLFALLWSAAAIAVAVWNGQGIRKGEKGQDTKTRRDTGALSSRADAVKKGCAAFAFGSESKCTVSKATVGFAVVIFLLFVATSYISVRAMLEFRKTGVNVTLAPSGDRNRKEELSGEDGKDVWSTNTDELNAHMADDHVQFGQSEGDREGLLSHQQSSDDLAHPGRRTSYHSQLATAPAYDTSYAPSALSPTGILGANTPGDTSGRVLFPEANYSALR
ncbi:uncharacterized protein RCC_07279 [Ramularia collo-cygni]|uniref:MARVEL domain-containing protein n=1 Tax=Ramularia collo-cygni TaxID=112498 RepID=A0A2D3VCH2_9PEZI|nr:uncharacterized protein RCC_07279 [Ramularia collo-cygni]CZT21416.1 uncharacterized protein RCC_07279 [Ramularia collo-cygni]